MRALRLVAAASVLVAAAVAASGSAATSGDKRLSSAGQRVSFGGGKVQVAGVARPEQCVEGTSCQTTYLDVALPTGIWRRADDGLQVSIRWPSIDDEFDLYVYGPDGSLAAYGDQLDSDAQSVVIPKAANGRYKIVVAAKYFSNGDTAAVAASADPKTYTGVAHVHRGALRGGRAVPLLPTISVVPPHDFHLDGIPPIPSLPIGYRFPEPVTVPTSCYLEETAQEGAQRCLRFDNELANVGAGELTLRFRWDGTSLANNCQMQQVVHWSDGHLTYRDAGPCVFHLQHAHFHYQNMGRYYLYPVDRSGRRAAFPITQSKKVGFCAIDVDYFGFGRPDSAPRTHSFPTCNVPSEVAPAGVWEYMGIGRGWGDVYTWDLPSQYLEITGVPDGVYDVVSVANPDRGIAVQSAAGQVSASRIRIAGTTVKVIREGVDATGRPTGDPRRRF